MNKHWSYFQSWKSSFTQFVPSFDRPGMPGRWWILRQCCTTNTRTKGVMRKRSCDMPAVPALIVKPATATARSTALTTVLCPHRARKRSMRWESLRIKPSSHPATLAIQFSQQHISVWNIALCLTEILNSKLKWLSRLCHSHVKSTCRMLYVLQYSCFSFCHASKSICCVLSLPQDLSKTLLLYTVPAVQGFFRSISLSRGNNLQDTLRWVKGLWHALDKYFKQPRSTRLHGHPTDMACGDRRTSSGWL